MSRLGQVVKDIKSYCLVIKLVISYHECLDTVW